MLSGYVLNMGSSSSLKEAAPEASPSHHVTSTTGSTTTPTSALSLLFSSAPPPGSPLKKPSQPVFIGSDHDPAAQSSRVEDVEACQVAPALFAFSSVGRLTLPIATTFLSLLAHSCASKPRGRRQPRVADVSAALAPLVSFCQVATLDRR